MKRVVPPTSAHLVTLRVCLGFRVSSSASAGYPGASIPIHTHHRVNSAVALRYGVTSVRLLYSPRLVSERSSLVVDVLSSHCRVTMAGFGVTVVTVS